MELGLFDDGEDCKHTSLGLMEIPNNIYDAGFSQWRGSTVLFYNMEFVLSWQNPTQLQIPAFMMAHPKLSIRIPAE